MFGNKQFRFNYFTFFLIAILLAGCVEIQNSDQSNPKPSIIRFLDQKIFIDTAHSLILPVQYKNNFKLSPHYQSATMDFLFFKAPHSIMSIFNEHDSIKPPVLVIDGKKFTQYESFTDLQEHVNGWTFGKRLNTASGHHIHPDTTYEYEVQLPTGYEPVIFHFDCNVSNSGLKIENNGKLVSYSADQHGLSLTIPSGALPAGKSKLVLKTANIKSQCRLRSYQVGSDDTIIVKTNTIQNKTPDAELSFNWSERPQRLLIDHIENDGYILKKDGFPKSTPVFRPFWQDIRSEAKVIKRAFALLPEQSVSFTVSIPDDGGELSFSLGHDAGDQLKKAVLEIVIKQGNEEEAIYGEELGALGKSHWYDRTLDLNKFAGKKITIVLRYIWPDKLSELSYIGIGEPMVVTSKAKNKRQKNVILISLDTMRADRLSLSGHERKSTPFIDSLADKGFWANNFYSLTSYTLPAHKTMLTGFNHFYLDYLAGNPQKKRALPANIPLLSTYFKNAGYRTIGLCEKGFVSPIWGFDRDFDSYYEYEEGFGIFKEIEGVKRVFKKLKTDAFSNWLDSNNFNEPFFAFIHTYNPHLRYSSLGYEGLWSEQDPDMNFAPDILDARGLSLTPEMIQHVNLVYDRNLRRTDHELQTFLSNLEKKGLLDNTLIVITSDHGEMMGHHNMLAKHGNIWEGVLRVPLVIYGDKLPDQACSDVRFSLESLTPSILSLAGVPVPDYLSDIQISNLSHVDQTILPVYISNKREIVALIKGDYKYILFEDRESLYNIAKDPKEESELDLKSSRYFDLATKMRHEACLRLAEEIPGWSLYLPNSEKKKLRVMLSNSKSDDLFKLQSAEFNLKNTRFAINTTLAEADGSSLLYCFEPKRDIDINLVIEEWNESGKVWLPFAEEIVFNGSSQVDPSNMILITDQYEKVKIEKLLDVSCKNANNLWFTVKPFTSGGKINEVSLSEEDLENLKNLGYLQ